MSGSNSPTCCHETSEWKEPYHQPWPEQASQSPEHYWSTIFQMLSARARPQEKGKGTKILSCVQGYTVIPWWPWGLDWFSPQLDETYKHLVISEHVTGIHGLTDLNSAKIYNAKQLTTKQQSNQSIKPIKPSNQWNILKPSNQSRKCQTNQGDIMKHNQTN